MYNGITVITELTIVNLPPKDSKDSYQFCNLPFVLSRKTCQSFTLSFYHAMGYPNK
jgi:hypothetical protein